MSVTIVGIILLLLLSTCSWAVTGERVSSTDRLVATDPNVELVLKRIDQATDVEELLELCAVAAFEAQMILMSGWLSDACRKRLRDLMLALRKTMLSNSDVKWKFVAAGVHCVASPKTLVLEDASREAKKNCADFCQGQADGFTLFLGMGSWRCSCCSSMSSHSSDGDHARMYRLVSSSGVQAFRGRLQREYSDICHTDRLEHISLGSVNFVAQNGKSVEVSIAQATPPEFFQCPHLCIENAQVTSWMYGDSDLMVWMYPSGKDPVWCQDSKEHLPTSVWSYYVNDAIYDVSVCHSETFYPLPMLKASLRTNGGTNSIFVDDVATYGHVEWDGHIEKGVCKRLFLGALEAVKPLMNPLVVELSFTARPTDKGCGCYAGAFFTKFGALSLTISGVSFDICSAAELFQICGSAELLPGQWSMRRTQACS